MFPSIAILVGFGDTDGMILDGFPFTCLTVYPKARRNRTASESFFWFAHCITPENLATIIDFTIITQIAARLFSQRMTAIQTSLLV
jgi:hypothetical protein